MKNNSLQLNPNVDYIKDIKNSKQDKLTAGEGITIDENNVISAAGGKLYRHNIVVTKGYNDKMYFVLYSKTSSPYTRVYDMQKELESNKEYQCSGIAVVNNVAKILTLFKRSSTSLLAYYWENGSYNLAEFSNPSVTDFVQDLDDIS